MPTELREAGLRIPKLHSAGCSRAEPATANKMRFWEEQENAGYQLYMKIQRNIGSPLARSAFRSRSVPAASTNEAGTGHERQAVATQAASVAYTTPEIPAKATPSKARASTGNVLKNCIFSLSVIKAMYNKERIAIFARNLCF